MKKKLLALTLSASMVMSMAACGGEDNTEDPTPTTAPTNAANPTEPTKSPDNTGEGATPVPTEAQDTPAPTEAPSYDFGGRTVRIGSYYDMTPNPDSSYFDKAFSERIKFVEENYNCNIEFVNVGGDYVSAYVTSVLAGDPVCDVGYILSYQLLPALIEGGIAYPISDLGVIDFTKPWYQDSAINASTYKGKVYAVGKVGPDVQYGIFYNKTLFQQYNLPDLYELYDKGEWNWENFKDIAIKGNVDLDGDGEYDIHGFNQRENFIWSFMASNGADAVKKTDAGVELALDSQAAQEALEAYADFMQNVPHMAGWQGDWQAQIYSFRDGQSMMCYEAWWITSYLNNEETGMKDEWGFVPFPLGPSGTEYVSYGKESSPWMMLNGIDKPEEVATILDLIFQVFEDEEEYEEAIVTNFEASASDAKAVEICLELMPKVSISPLMGFTDLNKLLNEEVFKSIENGSNTPQSALEAYKSALDAMMEDIKNHDYSQDLVDQYINVEEEGEEGAAE